MNVRKDETQLEVHSFDFSAFPADTLFLDRRTLPATGGPALDRASAATPKPRKDRRRRVDPTTFEKQYSEDEIAFMNAIQSFKNRSGKMFPSHGDILNVALRLGYRQPVAEDPGADATSNLLGESVAAELVG